MSLPRLASFLLAILACYPLAARAEPQIVRALDIAPVWSAHPVGFELRTVGPRQFVAFYDDKRQMTIACRNLSEDHWQFVRLPSTLGWDSHNYVTLTADAAGQLHVSGNMHCIPLIYFRSERPYDITSLKKVPAMVGRNEQKCTYPRFLKGSRGELIFTYRDGRSGNGDQYFNVWDAEPRAWHRLLDAPLFAGGGKMSAYFAGPVQDKKGTFHICWVWRDTPDCATNHDLSYAESKDLMHWQRSDGAPLTLPITRTTGEVIDPVPPGGGIVNGNTKIGFDLEGRPVIAYHKFDAKGNTQLYNARREAAGWKIYQTSDWNSRWEFHGGGSIHFEIGFGPVESRGGQLTQTYHHPSGSGTWQLDPATLKPLGPATARREMPAGIGKLESKWPGMTMHTAGDAGASKGTRFVLRWETLGPNRDRPRPDPLPPPSMLRLYEIAE